jgi:hypothetical protein
MDERKRDIRSPLSRWQIENFTEADYLDPIEISSSDDQQKLIKSLRGLRQLHKERGKKRYLHH